MRRTQDGGRIVLRTATVAVMLIAALACVALPPSSTPDAVASVTFVEAQVLSLPAGAGEPQTGDLNGDGTNDVVVGSGSALTVALGDGTGGFGAPVQVTGQDNSRGIALTDVNGDDKLDVVQLSSTTLSVLPGRNDGTFGDVVSHEVSGEPSNFAVADVDGDHYPDLALDTFAGGQGDGFYVLRNKDDGSFGFTGWDGSAHYSHPGPTHVQGSDVNRDGRDDIVMFSWSGFLPPPMSPEVSGTHVYLANPDGTLSWRSALRGETDYHPPARLLGLGDFDGDGRVDAALADNFFMHAFWGGGDGTFLSQPASFDQTSETLGSVTAADLDGDHHDDLIAGYSGSTYGLDSPVKVWLGLGREPLFATDPFDVGAGVPTLPAAADLNGDGAPELLVVGPSPGRLVVHDSVAAAGFESDALDFGEHVVGAATTQTVEVFNDGAPPLHIASVASARADEFTITEDRCSGKALASDRSCQLTVRFAPAASGERETDLLVRATPPGLSGSTLLSGYGQPAPAAPPTAAPLAPPAAGSTPLTRQRLLRLLHIGSRITLGVRQRRVVLGRLANPPVQHAAVTLISAARPRGGRATDARVARGRKLILGRGSITIPDGRQRTLRVLLNRKGRTLLRREHRLRALARITATDAGGRLVSSSKQLTLALRKSRRARSTSHQGRHL